MKRLSVCFLITFGVLFFLSSYAFGKTSKAVIITSVYADLENQTVSIIGDNFGKKEPIVLLETEPLGVDFFANEDIVARLPYSLEPGTYRLTVIRHKKSGKKRDWDDDEDDDDEDGRRLPYHRFDTMDVTIGAVGTEGPQGEPGAQGPQGKIGPAGADGAQGPQGKIGPAGADGADGAQGPKGKIGPQGVQGKVGPQGPQGKQGEPGIPAPDRLGKKVAENLYEVHVRRIWSAGWYKDGISSPYGVVRGENYLKMGQNNETLFVTIQRKKTKNK